MRHRLLASSLAALVLAPALAAAPPIATSIPGLLLAQAAEDAPPPLRVFRLAHVPAPEAMDLVWEMIDGEMDVRIVADPRTNSLIGFAEETWVLDRVSELIELLDVAAPRDEPAMTRVIRLGPVADGDQMAGILSMLFGGERSSERVRIAWDPRARALVASGPAHRLDAVTKLAMELDPKLEAATPAPAEAPVLTTRLLWLVSGEDAGRPLPPDLAPVASELARLGIEDLRLAAQTLVPARMHATFSTGFDPMVAGQPWQVRLRGSIFPGDASGTYEIEFEVEGARAGGPGRLELATSVVSPIDHFVVLGVAPIGDRDSVLVLQLRSDR